MRELDKGVAICGDFEELSPAIEGNPLSIRRPVEAQYGRHGTLYEQHPAEVGTVGPHSEDAALIVEVLATRIYRDVYDGQAIIGPPVCIEEFPNEFEDRSARRIAAIARSKRVVATRRQQRDTC